MRLMYLATLAVVWAVAGALLWWGHLPPRPRRVLALLASAAGLVFLGVALNTAGQHEAATTGGFLIGSAYVTGTASALASLPYYLMTALCLLLGTAGLALSDRAARALRRHWLAAAIVLSIAVTLVRLILERAAAPPLLAWAFGVTALAPLVGAFFATSVWAEGDGWTRIVKALAVYGLAVRAWVTALYAAATFAHLGSTHYDLSRVVRARNAFTGRVHWFEPASLHQVVSLVALPQLLFWPLYTVAAGLLGAVLARVVRSWLMGRPREPQPLAGPVEMAAARQD
jgi:hypothetical protein